MSRKPNILLVEDKPEFANSIKRWLSDAGYNVHHLNQKETALEALSNIHFHLGVFDLRLDDADDENSDGMDLVKHIFEQGLKKHMGVIILTAYGTIDQVILAHNRYRVDRFITKEPGYRRELLQAVREIMEEKVKVNFDIEYNLEEASMFDQIVREVNFSDQEKPEAALLLSQLQDAMARIFPNASQVDIEWMNQGLSGAAVVMAYPRSGHRMMRPFVLKINRRDKVETEEKNYEEHVDPFLPVDRRAKLDGCEYSKHLGVLCYSFAQNDWQALDEFDQVFTDHSAADIVHGLENLIRITCYHWYEASVVRRSSIKSLYLEAFELSEDLLLERARGVLPTISYKDPTILIDGMGGPLLNPLSRLDLLTRPMSLRKCITHGDFNCRNIMVDQNQRYWLIDFYRTYDSHILRDFVVIETDIIYRLMPLTDHSEFSEFVTFLLNNMDRVKDFREVPSFSEPLMNKGAEILLFLRELGMETVGGLDPRREYLLSLLMATLNVVRLKHIPKERKEQALISASMICDYLGL